MYPSVSIPPAFAAFWYGQGDPMYAVYSRGGANPTEDELDRLNEVSDEILSFGDHARDDGEAPESDIEAADQMKAELARVGYVAD